MIGRRRNAGLLPDRLDGLVAVHLRHHDVHQRDRDVRRRLERRDRLAPGRRREHLHPAPLEHAAEREDVPHVVVDDQHRLADQVSSERCSRSSMRCLAGGRSATTRCRNNAVSSSSRSGDSTPLTTTLRASVWSSRVLLGRQLAAGEDDDGQVAPALIARAISLEDLEAGHVGQPQVEHDAVERLRRAARERLLRPCRRSTMSMSSWPSSSRMLELLGRVVLDDEQALAARRRVRLDAVQRAPRAPRVVVGLVTNAKAPRASPCCRSSSSVTICTGMWRVLRILLQLAQHRPAEHVRQEHVERDRRSAGYCARERQGVVAARGRRAP